jgi:ATP-dependent exoDNAse (exonuclease V) beta subunit
MKNITYISASAGSGKTYTLTERLKDVILNGEAAPEQIILTTFTKAAAGEFLERAKARFYQEGKINEANQLNQALIGTVDSISNTFVNRYWYLLGISPNLNVISKEDEKLFVSESLANLPSEEQINFFQNFAETFELEEPRSNTIDYNFWKNDLKKILNEAGSFTINDFTESRSASIKMVESVTQSFASLNYDRDMLMSKLGEVEAVIKNKNAKQPSDTGNKRLELIDKVKRIIAEPDSTDLEIGFTLYKMTSNGGFKKYKTVAEECAAYQDLALEAEKVWVCTEVRNLQLTFIEHIFELAERWQSEYIRYKKERHIIDYIDMEKYFLELITEDEYKSVQEDISRTYKFLFVDEFQDCSPTQIKIFDRLSDLVEHTVWVGDYKQAIYNFRGSDTELVKAVADKVQKINGKQNETLGTSYRSWPPVVKFCNKVFEPAFSDILSKEEVHLEPCEKRKAEYEENKKPCLKAWPIDDLDRGKISPKKIAKQVAANIARMIKDEKILPKDIAVLAHDNDELEPVSTELKKYNIPVLLGDKEYKDEDSIVLLKALLNLVANPDDTAARSTIAYLTQEGYGPAKILDTRFEERSKNKKDWEFLEDIPLIKKLLSKKEEYKSLGIAALVENLIIEMDLYNVIKGWQNNDSCVNNLHTAISIAQAYEEHCIQMSLPCTIYGYLDYLSNTEEKSAGSNDGVQLFTFHKSKGLERKNVILLSLGEDILEPKLMLKRNYYGVHTYHKVSPTPENLDPPMIIRMLPWIFGQKSIPEIIERRASENEMYSEITTKLIQEEKRLMYVAMTRPIECLILTVGNNNGLQRLSKIGFPVDEQISLDGAADIFQTGMKFIIENVADVGDWKYRAPDNTIIKLYNEKQEYRLRDVKSSECKTEKPVTAKIIFDAEKRITVNAPENQMNAVGTCLHDIFCVLEYKKNEGFVNQIIKNHNMEKALPAAGEIIEAWNNLEQFLVQKFGARINSYHELPFIQQYEGQIITGIIDLVWETKDGVVLIDYKSYPGKKNDVINPQHKHFAGIYAGQFECYERALCAAGKKVLSKMVYYHVLGIGVELHYN